MCTAALMAQLKPVKAGEAGRSGNGLLSLSQRTAQQVSGEAPTATTTPGDGVGLANQGILARRSAIRSNVEQR